MAWTSVLVLLLCLGSLVLVAGQLKDEMLDMETTIKKALNYNGSAPEIQEECHDRHVRCDDFAASGNCDSNPGFMIFTCPVACSACHLRDMETRCDRPNLNMSQFPIYAPGEMYTMFRNIVPRFQDVYGPIEILSSSPFIMTIDDFISPEEIRAFLTNIDSWERSTNSGKSNALGQSGVELSEGRTSSNSWCRAACQNNKHVQQVYKKIESLVRVPRDHYELFQILRYEIGQKYETHHDYGARERYLVSGPRILTLFLYLSDVDEGGETVFPALGISVKPKRGRALLWPSTLDYDPDIRDGRTTHEARPVLKGRKFAANVWIHLYNNEVAMKWGCTGSVTDRLDDPDLADGYIDQVEIIE